MPSRFEPCGLNQMYSLRYGTLPIVRATGGLVDTVQNYDEATGDGTGFIFHDLNPDALANTIGWALSTWFDRPAHSRPCGSAPWRRTSPGTAPRPRTRTCTGRRTSAGAGTIWQGEGNPSMEGPALGPHPSARMATPTTAR